VNKTLAGEEKLHAIIRTPIYTSLFTIETVTQFI